MLIALQVHPDNDFQAPDIAIVYIPVNLARYLKELSEQVNSMRRFNPNVYNISVWDYTVRLFQLDFDDEAAYDIEGKISSGPIEAVFEELPLLDEIGLDYCTVDVKSGSFEWRGRTETDVGFCTADVSTALLNRIIEEET